MLLYFLYWLLSPLLWLILPVISIFQPKIRKHWLKEKSTWKKAGASLAKGQAGKQVVVFHAASAGEFEQLKPILRRVSRENYFIILSFFSPTIYEKENHSSLSDAVVYHPFDFPWSARSFFKRLNIQYYITTRHDLWPHHLKIARKLGIKTALINANLYEGSLRNEPLFHSLNRLIFGSLNYICTGSERLKQNLQKFTPIDKIKITGDSRFDQVIERKNNNSIPLLPEIYQTETSIILASIISSDYPVVFAGLKIVYPNGEKDLASRKQRLIVVPHETEARMVQELKRKLSALDFNPEIYSDSEQNDTSRVVIVDTVGILADLYKYSKLAYVGAGFGAGVHSVIEPAVYGNAVAFGPNYGLLDEAVNMAETGVGAVVQSSEDFADFLGLTNNEQGLQELQEASRQFVMSQENASEKILKVIFVDG